MTIATLKSQVTVAPKEFEFEDVHPLRPADVDLRYLGSLTHGFANLFPLGGDSATATNELISALRAHLSRG